MTSITNALRILWPAIALSVALASVAVVAIGVGSSTEQVVAEMMVRVIIVVGMYVFIGNSRGRLAARGRVAARMPQALNREV